MVKTDTQVLEEVRQIGEYYGWLLNELDLPLSIKQIFVDMIEILEPEQLEALMQILEHAVAEQVVVQSHPDYLTEAARIDSLTAERLKTIVDRVAT